MRKVVKAQDVAHLFANQLQDEAMTPNRSFYFEGKSIYSYGRHFCIATFVDDNTLLFTTRGYSNTTAKHINVVRHATSHIKKIYCAYPLDGQINFDDWHNKADNVVRHLTSARKPEKYLLELDRIKSEAQEYANYFGIEIPKELEKIFSISNKEQYFEYADAKEKMLEAERKRKLKIQKKEHEEELKKWRSFEKAKMYTRMGIDYLRKTSEYFETSQGVRIPIDVGMRIYQNIKGLEIGSKVMDFTVNEITKDYIGIGCHKIKFNEIESIVR